MGTGARDHRPAGLRRLGRRQPRAPARRAGGCAWGKAHTGLNGHALLTPVNGHRHTALPEELHLEQTWLFNKPALAPCSGDLWSRSNAEMSCGAVPALLRPSGDNDQGSVCHKQFQQEGGGKVLSHICGAFGDDLPVAVAVPGGRRALHRTRHLSDGDGSRDQTSPFPAHASRARPSRAVHSPHPHLPTRSPPLLLPRSPERGRCRKLPAPQAGAQAVSGEEEAGAHRPRSPGSPGSPLPRAPAAPLTCRARAPAPPPAAPAAGGRRGVRGDQGNKRTRSEKGIKEGNVANTKNKRRNFPRGEERGKRHLHELFSPLHNFCRNSDNARARFPFPSPHKPVVVLLSLFRFIVLEVLNHKTGVSENGIYLTEISPTLF